MKLFSSVLLCSGALLVLLSSSVSGHAPESTAAAGPSSAFAMRPAKNATEARFLAVPDPKLAEEHLRTLTQAPHMAGRPRMKHREIRGAEVSRRGTRYGDCRVQGLDQLSAGNQRGHNRARWSRNARATREHVDGDAYDEDPRVVMPFNGMSPSGDAEAEVVYANYGTPEDLKSWRSLKIDVRGKIVLVRYGQNFRG